MLFSLKASQYGYPAEVQAERQIASITALIATFGLIIVFLCFAFQPAPIKWLLYAKAGILATWLLYNLGILKWLQDFSIVPFFARMATIIDISVIAGLNFLVLRHAPFHFINGPLVALYFIIICTATLRHNAKLVIQTGIMCALVHMGLSIYSFFSHHIPFSFDVENIHGLQLHWIFANELLISIAMALFGLIVGYATKELIAKENHYLALFDSIPDGILIASPNMRILASNRKFQQMAGKHEQDLLGKPLHRFLGKKTSSYSINPDADSLKDSLFTKLYTKQEVIPVQVSQVPIDWNGQKCLELSIRDMSERYNLELKLARAQKVQTVGKLAGSLAHDLNNILGGIFGAVSLSKRTVLRLENPKETAALEAYLNTISDCGQTASQILDRLSTFSRSSLVETTTVEILDVLQETATIMSNTLNDNISILVEDTCPLTVKADRTSLAQALLNLCKNAKDAIGNAPGKIILKAKPVSSSKIPLPLNLDAEVDYICISVSDNGPGMDEETQKKIFDPFFTTKEKGEGTGIGLSMVYNVAFGHGGAMEVESSPGSGATFRIYIEASRDSLIPLAH